MSKIKLTGHGSGSGTLTIQAPDTDSSRTITLPDSTGTLLDSTSTLDATKVSGTHTNFTSTGIDDNAAGATAITITSNEDIGIGEVDPQTDLSILTSGAASVSAHDSGIQVRHTGASGEFSGLTAGDIANTTYNCGFIGFKGGSGTASGQRHIVLATRSGTADTAPVEGLRLEDTGYVTMPAKRQAAFRATVNGTISVSTGTPILFELAQDNDKNYNLSGCYSTSTGKFTAPVAGVYHFTGGAMTTGWSNGNNTQDLMRFYNNHRHFTYGLLRTSAHNSTLYANGYYMEGAMCDMLLDAGDTVWMQVGIACGVSNGEYTYFSGFLVG